MIKTTIYQGFKHNYTPNISITSSNFGILTTETAWRNKLITDGALNVVIKNFKNIGNTISFFLNTSNLIDLRLNNLNITSVNTFSFKKCNRFFLNNNSLNIINTPFAQVGELQLHYNQFTSANFTIALPSIYRLYMYNNLLTTFDPPFPLVGVAYLLLYNNFITEFNPTYPLPNILIDLNLANNRLTKFNPTIPLPTSVTTIRLVSNLINTAGWADSEPWANGLHSTTTGKIYIGGNTNSPIGTNFANILTAKGWTLLDF